MNLATIRDDLKTRLATISGLQVYDTVPASPVVPCAIVTPSSIIVHAAFERGACEVRFTVQVLVQLAEWATAQDALDGYCAIGASTSVVDAIELQTTGGEDATVETVEDYGTTTSDDGLTSYGTVTFNVVVHTSA